MLRVSAKYTQFDILPYTVVVSRNQTERRPGRKAAVIQELLQQGLRCDTHFAQLYPQWANYTEDQKPWKAHGPPGRGKQVRKISKEEYVARKAGMVEELVKMRSPHEVPKARPKKVPGKKGVNSQGGMIADKYKGYCAQNTSTGTSITYDTTGGYISYKDKWG